MKSFSEKLAWELFRIIGLGVILSFLALIVCRALPLAIDQTVLMWNGVMEPSGSLVCLMAIVVLCALGAWKSFKTFYTE